MTGERPDADLVAEYLRTGEPAFFENLVRRHWGRIVRVVLSVLGPEHSMDAEDVAQQVVIRTHDTLRAFRGESLFTTWLYRIAYNQAIDHTRRATRRRRLIQDSPMPVDREPVSPPDAATLADERSRLINRALDQVPHPYRAALRLYYWFDMPVREVAETLGVGRDTVKSYLHRGRQRLRRLVDETEVQP